MRGKFVIYVGKLLYGSVVKEILELSLTIYMVVGRGKRKFIKYRNKIRNGGKR